MAHKLTKQEMIRQLAHQHDLSLHEAQKYVEAMMEMFSDALSQGGQIIYRDIFTIQVVEYTPKGGAYRGKMPAKAYRLYVRAGSELKRRLLKIK